MKLIDLIYTFDNVTPVFPGDPKPRLEQVAFIEKDSFNDHKISTVMHVGTHMDAPLHMIENGATIEGLSLERFIGRGVLIDACGKKEVDTSILKAYTIHAGDIVLLYTG